MASPIYKKADGIDCAETAEGSIAFIHNRAFAFQLNATAAAIFELCNGQRDVEDIAGIIQEAFKLEKKPQADIDAFIQSLLAAGLVEPYLAASATCAEILDISELDSTQFVALAPTEKNHQGIAVTWMVGKRCNYKCSYCPKEYHDTVSSHRRLDELDLAWLRLKQVIPVGGQLSLLSFTGGEPTLNPNFHHFVERLNREERNWIGCMGMTTNGTESFDYYHSILKSLDFITFSTHYEWWNEAKFMTLVLDLWRSSGKNRRGKWIQVNLMCEGWEDIAVQRIHKILKAERIPQTPIKIVNIYGSKGIANSESNLFNYCEYLNARGEGADGVDTLQSNAVNGIEKLLDHEQRSPDIADVLICLADGTIGKTNSIQLQNFGLTNFPGWICHLERGYFIHHDGGVWAGHCRYAYLGNVYQGFKPLPGPVVCDGRFCGCTTDIKLEKYNPEPARKLSIPSEFRRETFDRKPKNAARG